MAIRGKYYSTTVYTHNSNSLMKVRQEDCRRNEYISNKRQENKKKVWLNKYEETFKIKYQSKNPYIKISEETEKKKLYTEVSAGQPQVRIQDQIHCTAIPKIRLQIKNNGKSTETQQQRQNRRQEGLPVQSQPLPQRMPRNCRGTRLEGRRQPSPTQFYYIHVTPNRNTTYTYEERGNENTQFSFQDKAGVESWDGAKAWTEADVVDTDPAS